MKKRSLLLGGIAGAGLVSTLMFGQPFKNTVEPTIVKTGEIGYSSKGDLVSHDFVTCSAVVFDYDNVTIMGHAYPSTKTNMCDKAHNSLSDCTDHISVTTLGNVVPRMIAYSKKLGLNPSDARVYVNAGDPSSLEKITNDLSKNSVNMTSGKARWINTYRIHSREFLRTLVFSQKDKKIQMYREGEYLGAEHKCQN